MDWCGDNKTLDSQGRSEGHLNFSKALNQTGRHMAFELCRGPYQKMDHWVRSAGALSLYLLVMTDAMSWLQGYADAVAQVWRAASDHHDSFSHTLEQLAAIKGKSAWSRPYGWAYSTNLSTRCQGRRYAATTADADASITRVQCVYLCMQWT